MAKLTIDVISDAVCPWCFLGGEYLRLALLQCPDIEAEVRWRPFQLNPDIPGEGVPRADYIRQKFGDTARFQQAQQALLARGEEAGVAFDFDAIALAPNTLDAHRLILWAAQSGHAAQTRVARTIFSAYFEQGKDIGDPAVLTAIAAAEGLDAESAAAFLLSGAGVETVLAEIQAAHRIGVTGVPFFLLNGKYSVSGAQPPEAMARMLRTAAQA